MSPWLGIVAVVVAFVVFRMLFGPRPDIRGAEARRLVAEGARLLDVRTPQEYAGGHLPGAVNIPLQALPRRLRDLGSRERAVIVYCASGSRSALARRLLVQGGFTQVHDLGPMRAW